MLTVTAKDYTYQSYNIFILKSLYGYVSSVFKLEKGFQKNE